MLAWRSQQAVTSHFAADQCLLGLKVNVLCEKLFANGRISLDYVDNRMKPKDKEGLKPIIWHINWTKNSTEKLARMKALQLWYLDGLVPN